MSALEIILTIVTTLLGGGNIFQIFQIKQLKARQAADTETVAIKNMQLVIESMQAEITRLNSRVIELETQNAHLQEFVNKLKI